MSFNSNQRSIGFKELTVFNNYKTLSLINLFQTINDYYISQFGCYLFLKMFFDCTQCKYYFFK
jgi:hypothetical protein